MVIHGRTERLAKQGGFPKNDFWDFSLALYGRPAVAPACLALQDEHGADVNVLMWCCWIGASGRGVVEPAELDTVLAAVRWWQDDVVMPLRHVRRRLKGVSSTAPEDVVETVRKRIAKVEIDTEHVQQLMLSAMARPARATRAAERRAGDAARNLKRYVAALGAAPDDAHLGALLAGAFPDIARAGIDALLAADA